LSKEFILLKMHFVAEGIVGASCISRYTAGIEEFAAKSAELKSPQIKIGSAGVFVKEREP